MKLCLSFILSVLFLYPYGMDLFGQAPTTENVIQREINAVAAHSNMKHASFSVCVIDVTSNQVIASYNPNQSLIPASSLKTITTGTALAILGPDFQFKTEILTDGRIDKEGNLTGNLYIKGYGDPTLGSPNMSGVAGYEEILHIFAEAIHKKNVKRLNGLVIGDGTYFETAISSPTWQWNDIGNYYGAGPSGLNIHENFYYMNFRLSSSLKTGPVLDNVSPEMPYMIFINELTSADKNSGDNAYIFGAPYTFTRFIRGTLPVGNRNFEVKGSIPDPAYFTAKSLLRKLEEIGVHTNKRATTERELIREGKNLNIERRKIYEHKSPPLWQIVDRANQESVNLYCEAMLKTMGMKKYAEGSTSAGLKAIEEFWVERGVNWNGFVMKDGSGLSPRNTVSTYHMALILRKIAKDKTIFPYFFESLPKAGQEGTVKNMLKGTNADGKMRMKSGSMSRIRSYSGYMKTNSGRLVSFSIIANHFLGNSGAMRSQMEKIMAEIANLP